MTSAADASKWHQHRRNEGWRGLHQQWHQRGAWRRMRACERRVGVRERKPKCAVASGRHVGHVISRTEHLNCAWGHVQSSMASRIPQVCRSTQDDLSGTFTNVIEAIFVVVIQMAVVCAMWNSLTMAAVGLEPKDNGWMTSLVQRREVAAAVVMAKAILKRESH